MHKQKMMGLLICLLTLQGCVAAFIAGATAGGLVVYDQRSFEMINTDNTIRHKGQVWLAKDPVFKGSHITLSSFNRIVLLTGQTPKASVRVTAEKLAHSIPNVKRVYNEITIGQPTSIAQRTMDTWITTAIKTQMLTKKGLRSGSIKVITENSTVFLMGKVTHDQANIAVDIARRTDDVRKVVKVFQYVD